METCVTARRGAPIAFRQQIFRLDTKSPPPRLLVSAILDGDPARAPVPRRTGEGLRRHSQLRCFGRAPPQQVAFAPVACQARGRFEFGARFPVTPELVEQIASDA